jgi:hypothetical protein
MSLLHTLPCELVSLLHTLPCELMSLLHTLHCELVSLLHILPCELMSRGRNNNIKTNVVMLTHGTEKTTWLIL